ncbi:hypothetical protein BLNAU_18005 [Blattamonas nauphoetae]|uniref:Uncharacterized protein n=1 Tax=Blattamonas nauphoetae TaxID=2049346 RepID=A0ABQ9X8S3_9EUKA|nr:hypothetical protein BLNAU_18005 [Blattamonas nauphoetae]
MYSALEHKLFEIPAAVCLEASSMDEGFIRDALYLLKTLMIMHRESHLGGIGHASSCPLCSSSFRSFWTSSWKILRMQMNRRKTYQITIEVMSELVTESMTRLSLDGSPEPKDTVGVNMDQSRQKHKHTSLLKEITRIDESNMFPGHVPQVAPSGPAKVSMSTFLLDSLQQTLSLLITDFKNHHIHQTPTTTILSSTPHDSQIEQKSQDLFNVMDSIILLLSTQYTLLQARFRLALRLRDNSVDSLIIFVFLKITHIILVSYTVNHHSSPPILPVHSASPSLPPIVTRPRFSILPHPLFANSTHSTIQLRLLLSPDTSDLTRQAPHQRLSVQSQSTNSNEESDDTNTNDEAPYIDRLTFSRECDISSTTKRPFEATCG